MTVGSTPDTGGSEALLAAQAQAWRLGFPPALEAEFRAHSAASAAMFIRGTLPWLTLMYLLVLGAIAFATHDDAATLWRNEALLPAGLSLAILWAAFPFRRLDRHLSTLMGLGMLGALALMTRGVFLVDHTPLGRPVSYCVVYVLLIIFALARLRLRQSLAATGLALGIVVVSTLAEGLEPDWLSFAFYFPMTAILCAVVGYLIEYRERTDFLGARLLAIDKTRLEEMQVTAARDGQRRQLLATYLEHVSGNLTPTEIAGRSLRFLIEHAGALVGTVYLVDGERLRRAASWALEGELRSSSDIGRGETLIGQAAENGRRMRLRHLPADYHPISTATGRASPAELLVEPVAHNGVVLAVIELGALQALEDHQVELIDRIGKAMANALVAANARDALARANMVDFTI